MSKIIVCDADNTIIRSCCKALQTYDLATSNSMKDCLEIYARDDEKPELLLSAYQLNDGTAVQVAQAMSEIGFIKVIVMTTAELGHAVLEPLYADNLLHATIAKPFKANALGELVARTLARCPICRAHVMGNTRELPCSYCKGTGRYTSAGYAYFLHHRCDCINNICDVCRMACHHLD